MSTQIDYSTIESETLGLKIGRCNHDAFDEKELYRQITEKRFDICRLKVPAEDEFAMYRIHQMGLPAFFSGSIRRYKTKIKEKPEGKYNNDNLVWELYDGTQDKLLKDMLVGTWGNYPIGYYRTPYLSRLITKEQEIESVFRFYKKHNNTKDYPDNSIVFIKHGENYVGFFALNILNGNLESHVGGILEPYRKGGYFLDKLRFIKEYCVSHQLEHFIFGARNENAEVQRIFQHVGFQPIGSENVFHIPSLFSFSKSEPIEKEVTISENTTAALYTILLSEALALVSSLSKYNVISFHLNNTEQVCKQKSLRIRFSFPVLTKDELLIVIQCAENREDLFTGYLRLHT